MITLTIYELKQLNKYIIYTCIYTIITFTIMYGITCLFPDFILNLIMIINKSPFLLALCGRTDYIESINLFEVAMLTLNIINPILFFRICCSYNYSFNNDVKSGMMMYLNSQNISKSYYWLTQLIVNTLSYLIIIIILGICFTFMSLTGIPVKILREITFDKVVKCLFAVSSVGFLFLSLGILFGVLFNFIKKYIIKLFIYMIVICIIPNIANVLNVLTSDSDLDYIFQHFSTITHYIRNIIPLYWCNPWNPIGKNFCLILIFISIINIAISFLLYRRKNTAIF